MDMTLLIIGVILFVVLGAVVAGGFTFYRRNVEPGSESKDPDKFTQ